MEYAEKGDLNVKIEAYKAAKKSVPEELIWKVLFHIAKGSAAFTQDSITFTLTAFFIGISSQPTFFSQIQASSKSVTLT